MTFRIVLVAFLFILFTVPTSALSGDANVFVYHRFGDSRYPSTNTDIPIFQEHLDILKKNRFVVLTLGDVVTTLREHRELPERCAVITVDDAYDTFLSGAMPLLRQYGYPATLFVSTRSVGRPGYLDWPEIRSLAEEGIEIGNHSAAHPDYLTTQQNKSFDAFKIGVLDDISEAEEEFLREIGRTPALFAYPYGEYSPELLEIVKKAGFSGAAAQISGVVHNRSNLWALPRFPMGGPYGESSAFREKLFMQALHVEVLTPSSPLMSGENPPSLLIRIADDNINPEGLHCYVSGSMKCNIVKIEGEEKIYRVRAKEPLTGRRSRYTVTAPGRQGGWHWFSQLWVDPKR